MTIRFVLFVNKQGQTRVAQYYEHLSLDERRALEGEIVRKCLARTDQQVRPPATSPNLLEFLLGFRDPRTSPAANLGPRSGGVRACAPSWICIGVRFFLHLEFLRRALLFCADAVLVRGAPELQGRVQALRLSLLPRRRRQR